MRNFSLYKQKINRRAFAMMGVQSLAFSVLGARLFSLQSIEKNKYLMLSENNRLKVILLAPIRGEVFDAMGKKITYNRRTFRVHIIKENISALKESLEKLKEIIKITDNDIAETLKRAKYRSAYASILVREDLSWEEMSKVSAYKVYLKGVEIMEGESRTYSEDETYAHLLGYVGKVAKDDVERGDSALLDLPGFEMGKRGVEKVYETLLRGQVGVRQIEVDVKGRHIRTFETKNPVKGKNINLTIDDKLQKSARNILKPYKSASMVVMDVKTGAIKAIVSQPSFDPNLFVSGISHKNWDALLYNKYKPLINKPVSGQYAPGSLFKMVVMLAALKFKIKTSETVVCKGYTKIANRRFHCWKKRGHGRVNMNKSLRESCDIWYYEMSLKVGIDNIAKLARQLGLGQTYDLGLDSQSTGIVPDKAWKRNRYNKDWYIGETVIASIGQGYVLSTPLQLAVMTARIASGDEIMPQISSVDPNGEAINTQYKKLSIPKKHLDVVRKSMYEVVHHYRGTAKRSQLNDWIMAGKTGTAQVRTISQSERESEDGIIENRDLEWKYRDHALFCGYAPFNNPKFAVVVVVEHGGSGSVIAAPLAKRMFDEISAIYPETSKEKKKS